MIGEIGNFNMKKLLLILLCLPFIGFGQCISGDCENGKGTFTYDNGAKYVGEFKNYKWHGQGTATWSNGTTFTGRWEESKRNGYGVATWSNETYTKRAKSSKYEGEWKDNKQHGQGTKTYSDGYKYVGEWKGGNRHGQGHGTTSNDYIGFGYNLLKPKENPESRIITYIFDGSPAEKKGLLVDDIILSVNDKSYTEWWKETEKEGLKIGNKHKFLIERKGKREKLKIAVGKVSNLNSPAGMSYTGEWKKDKPSGIGTVLYFNGSVEKGVFKDWKLIESLKIEDRIKKIVEQKVNEWQKKGEFEKTNDYLVRVSERNRTIKIKGLQEEAITSLKRDFCKSIDFSNIELGDYDADNETFLLKDSKLGNLVISVPMSEAKGFKKSFNVRNFFSPECVIIDDEFVLSYLAMKNYHYNRPPYTYNLSNSQDYSITDIDYEFSAIEIDDITSVKKTKSSNISTNKLKVGTSSVNINIPTNSKVKNRYALVIGNEDYSSFQRTLSSEQNVDYAENDAAIFKKYCLNTLGVKEDNMFFLTNATAGTMHQEIDLITKIINKVGRKAELIVYYAGHGYPDELTKVPYLIPVDVSASNLSTAIKLDDLYQKLANTNASKITIFLDACFTGGGRNSGLVASRGVKVKPKEGVLDGNIVVFSASSAEESSLPYHDEGHGVFTYFLLKKFQESEGNVTLGELSEYLDENVSIKSLRVNQKEQNPTVNTSSKVINDWRNWKF